MFTGRIQQVCLTAVSSSREFALLDLRGAGAYELGVDTDASRARAHTAGQAFSQAVHEELPDVDAILFDSRLTTGACVAVYDRAFPALSATVLIAALIPLGDMFTILAAKGRTGTTLSVHSLSMPAEPPPAGLHHRNAALLDQPDRLQLELSTELSPSHLPPPIL